MCYGRIAHPTTMATPRKSIVPLATVSASQLPTITMPQRIAYARTRSGMSITAMAAAIGVHKDYYKLIEQRCDRISIPTLCAISSVTGSDLDWLIYGPVAPPHIPLTAPTIGQRLRQFRTQNGITCKALAQTAFGVNKLSSISKWETDRMFPELRTLKLIADAYHISVTSFIKAGD